MDKVQASLERMTALWLKLKRAKPNTPEYGELVKQIRDESDNYNALIDAETSADSKHEDSN